MYIGGWKDRAVGDPAPEDTERHLGELTLQFVNPQIATGTPVCRRIIVNQVKGYPELSYDNSACL